MPGAGSNAQSTAFAVQGLLAAGVDPGTMRRRGASPLDYLRGLIASDGHVRYARNADQTPTWVTAEALLALAEKTLPLAPVARRAMAPARRPTPHASNRHHATATPGQRRARAARHAPARPAPARRTAVLGAAAPRTADLAVDRLTIAAAILTALSLAPLGQG